MSTIRRLLIANRGEIAVRVIGACPEMFTRARAEGMPISVGQPYHCATGVK